MKKINSRSRRLAEQWYVLVGCWDEKYQVELLGRLPVVVRK